MPQPRPELRTEEMKPKVIGGNSGELLRKKKREPEIVLVRPNARYFEKFDLRSGYYQVRITEGDEPKMTDKQVSKEGNSDQWSSLPPNKDTSPRRFSRILLIQFGTSSYISYPLEQPVQKSSSRPFLLEWRA
ncbi:hypothetical protein HPP92_006948 [Vanilla planifolia]|uniref:Reverse transcriptase n=1 Tax=Vanilla planifolia TaxID=51239 RepID=A0A835RD63_VANPL|nr:hypothetical protein HPP92_006948 [Vanilla planifolia]